MSPSVRRLRPVTLPVVVAASCALVLTGCAGSSGGAAQTSATPSPSISSPAPVRTAAGPVPTVTGDFGKPPVITIPKEDPADALVTATVIEGSGATVQAGDLLIVNYVGETWADGKVFDESFGRGAPTGFAIGVGAVITGWDAALVGQTVGSRVVMAIPPDLGYGEQGQPSAGIAGDDTLVFVVDILGAYPAGSPAAAGAAPTGADLSGLPTVTGDLGSQPTVTVPNGTEPPTKDAQVVIAQGDGAKIQSGSFVVVNYQALDWTGNVVGSSWTQGQPFGVAVGTAQPTPFDALEGLTVGSRVMLLIPSQGTADPATDSIVVVVDILDAIPPAK